jgi:hypothetical protein
MPCGTSEPCCRPLAGFSTCHPAKTQDGTQGLTQPSLSAPQPPPIRPCEPVTAWTTRRRFWHRCVGQGTGKTPAPAPRHNIRLNDAFQMSRWPARHLPAFLFGAPVHSLGRVVVLRLGILRPALRPRLVALRRLVACPRSAQRPASWRQDFDAGTNMSSWSIQIEIGRRRWKPDHPRRPTARQVPPRQRRICRAKCDSAAHGGQKNKPAR